MLANTIASKHHALASSIEPAVKAKVPKIVFAIPLSYNIRANIGKAVIDMEAPKYKAAAQEVMSGLKSCALLYKNKATIAPNVNGAMIPAADIRTALLTFLFNKSAFNSKPIKNI
jgi:hypothetical protein